MSTKEPIREMRELRKLLADLHRDTRGAHGQCPCTRTGAVCVLHSQVRHHILTAENSLRDAIILLNESTMTHTR
ncbi:MAG: hypothetical protein AB7L09_24725 [Nitrospira sp.]